MGIQEAKEKIQKILDADRDTSRGAVKEVILPISEEEAKKLSRATGLDITPAYKHVLDKSGVSHAFKKHGGERESLRGQKRLTKEDILRIPEIITSYDKVEVPFDHDGNPEKSAAGNDLIRYEKTFADGTTYYVEEVRAGRRELALSTMWIKEKGKTAKAFPLSSGSEHMLGISTPQALNVRNDSPHPDYKDNTNLS